MPKQKQYDQDFYDALVEEGFSASAAGYIAAAEMEGAATDENGFIDSMQTYCNKLGYNEAGPKISRAMREAREKTRDEALDMVKELGYGSMKEYYAAMEQEHTRKLGIAKKYGFDSITQYTEAVKKGLIQSDPDFNR